ncbi:MAG: aldehyde ferredoxin oxidoreductase family protein [Pseudomonadota bacterium]
MDDIIGCTNKILDIDLTAREWSVFEVSEQDRRLYLGGKGLGLKLLHDRLEPGVDPLGEKNMLVIMPGVLMGTGAPCSGRFEAITKSPLTGIIGTSSCGGPFGMQLKTAGYGGLIIRGKSERPCLVHITHDSVSFSDANHLWGLDTMRLQEKILQNKEGALVIGPAGENCVRFANIASGDRFLGRGGFGAVMGSKKLKGIIASGSHYTIVPSDQVRFALLKKKALSYINRSSILASNRDFGTASNMKPVNTARMLPVWNFTFGRHDQAVRLSGEMIKEKHATTYHTCKPCSILCGHRGTFNGQKTSVPEYETLVLLGANLGIFDRDAISDLNDLCNRLGLDTISAGGTLAWVMEAAEKGFVKSSLRFGSTSGIKEALEDIAHGRGFGREMGQGSRALAFKYGGREFAMQVKGMEMAGYDPRGAYGQGLSYAVANRGGCHLSAFMVGLEVFARLLKPDTAKAKPRFVKFFEDITCGVNSLQTCQFTMYAYTLEPWLTRNTPDFLLRFLMMNVPALAIGVMDFSLYPGLYSAVTGIPMTSREFLKAGERIHVLERYLNTQEGVSRKDDTLPERVLYDVMPGDPEKRMVPLDAMLDDYYRIRGYDSDGIPSAATLARLQIPSDAR